jgi:hypothetical protein
MSNKITKIADNYRNEIGRCGGVVVVYDGEVSGWMNELRNPEHWAPGCIAVNFDGNQFKAVGGNDYDGSDHWENIG